MITIVVGGQYGGEGKGKICAFLAQHKKFDIVSRCGGPNSSHTIVEGENRYRFRMLPTSVSVSKTCKIVYGAGSLIHIETLFSEMNDWGVSADRILIDPNAGIVTNSCIKDQRADSRYSEIGSTLTGTGYASSQRALRKLTLASDERKLRPMLLNIENYLYQSQVDKKSLLVEGHQGAMLSNYHGDYPYCSSRDCTASGLLSELGLGPNWPMEIVLVVKTFETRNHAGSLSDEISTSHVERLGFEEFGGGSWGIENVRRRVGFFGFDVLRRAVRLNTPTCIALTAADYLVPTMHGVVDSKTATSEFNEFSASVELDSKVLIGIVSTGRETRQGYFTGKGTIGADQTQFGNMRCNQSKLANSINPGRIINSSGQEEAENRISDE